MSSGKRALSFKLMPERLSANFVKTPAKTNNANSSAVNFFIMLKNVPRYAETYVYPGLINWFAVRATQFSPGGGEVI